MSFIFSRWLVLRVLGVVYLLAFLSLWAQLDALYGARGIAPIADVVASLSGSSSLTFLDAPSLFWLGANDVSLHVVCALGVLVSLFAVCGVLAPLSFLWLWGSYLSFVSVGGVFLGFQWDALLLESGLLAILTAPWRVLSRPSQEREPVRAVRLLWWMLLFKLMLLAGLVKLNSGDKSWRDLTALSYHYVTQPLPLVTSYYLQKLPMFFHELGTSLTLLIELVLPFLIVGGRSLRHFAAAGFILLQVAIALSGNYGIFNLLTIALCLSLLDDALVKRLSPRWLGVGSVKGEAPHMPRRRMYFLTALSALLLLLSFLQVMSRNVGAQRLPTAARLALEAIAPFASIHSYGLFAVMTKLRDEIELEGSYDGREWRSYNFSYKPDRPDEPPRWVAPHMPRVDWQMWFASLGGCSRNQWLLRLQQRLLEGSPAVVSLFEEDPFPGRPPVYLRTTLYRYEFTPLGSQDYWRRTRLRSYCPTLTLYEGRLDAVVQ